VHFQAHNVLIILGIIFLSIYLYTCECKNCWIV
jgi:hypothetical protein